MPMIGPLIVNVIKNEIEFKRIKCKEESIKATCYILPNIIPPYSKVIKIKKESRSKKEAVNKLISEYRNNIKLRLEKVTEVTDVEPLLGKVIKEIKE